MKLGHEHHFKNQSSSQELHIHVPRDVIVQNWKIPVSLFLPLEILVYPAFFLSSTPLAKCQLKHP